MYKWAAIKFKIIMWMEQINKFMRRIDLSGFSNHKQY